MTDPTGDVESMITRLFEDKVGHTRVLEAEEATLLRDLWDTVADLGLPWVGVSEEAGGSGGSITDVVTLLRGAGRFAVPLPLMENHLAAWLWTTAGGQVSGTGPWSVAPGTPQDSLVMEGSRVSGTLRDVAWGAAVDRVVALVETDGDPVVLLLDPATAEVAAGRDLAGQPRDALTFSGAPAERSTSTLTADELARRGAVLRAAQMAGAMTATYELTQAYTAQRQQFGRPIGKFQAVRTHLVHLAQMAVMTGLCVDRAAAALETGRDASFDAFATKLLANQNAAVSIRSGHQAHGAIGMTREYALQDHTRRLNAWRGDWGSELALAERIGDAVLTAPSIARVATDEGSLSV
ncbi:MAG: acyl-CoA dehydrogenase family protein [Nocardioides sp.]|jgi:acyl-CoA dehydrogenase